ncbi:hypothetical protein SAMN05216551_10885 [Chitinasiproducens palmae]|uniref:Uncharacterized protein n=1 Tax=Chitinasiproducens palmae TaxID=1770053 RepID=A0A1H2PRE8_9BURK|nr:hypothetical protein SAMN05216551_10885 [Chitinasiproducens palmae]
MSGVRAGPGPAAGAACSSPLQPRRFSPADADPLIQAIGFFGNGGFEAKYFLMPVRIALAILSR